MKFYQACFGKPNNINWSLFHASQDLPAHLGSFYEKAENSNTPQNLDKKDMLDSNGNPLCMFEIISQGKAVAVSKVQYGTSDNMGRPKMFAHGFLFDESDDVLRDPNNILTISDSNFHFDMEYTKKAPETLERDVAYNLNTAMSMCGIDNENIIKLMACIYFSLTSATDFPIYIVSNKKDEILKPLVYCIYSLLPYSIRYNLSVSNANNFSKAQFKSIMLVDKEYSSSYYINLDTLETNIPLNEVYGNMGKYPFLQKLQTMGIDEFEQYCISLETELEKMQLKDSREYNTVKLADTFLQGLNYVRNLNDNELTRHLLEVTSYAPMQNSYIELYIANAAKIFLERGLMPNDGFLARLGVRSEKSSSKELVDIYKQLQMKVLIEAGTEKVVEFLGEQRVISWERFYDWCQYILKTEEGHKFIEKYYFNKFIMAKSLDEILALYEEGIQIISFESLMAMINEHSYALTKKQLLDRNCEDYSAVLEHYSGVYRSINGKVSCVRCRASIERLIDEYWHQFDLHNFQFSPKEIAKYQSMILEETENKKYEDVMMLVNFYSFLGDSENEYCTAKEFMKALVDMLNNIQENYNMSTQEFLFIAPKIQELVVKKMQRHSEANFLFWYRVAEFGYSETGVNPFECLLNWRLPVFFNEDNFKIYVMEKEKMYSYLPEFINLLGGIKGESGLLQAYDNKSEEYKILKRRLNLLIDKQNELEKIMKKEEKMKIKEEKKRSKETESETRDETKDDKQGKSKFGIFGGNSKRRK